MPLKFTKPNFTPSGGFSVSSKIEGVWSSSEIQTTCRVKIENDSSIIVYFNESKFVFIPTGEHTFSLKEMSFKYDEITDILYLNTIREKKIILTRN